MRSGPIQNRAEQLVEECEAFLHGSFVGHRVGISASLTVLNQLAHADWTHLERTATQPRTALTRGQDTTWSETASFLATELLSLCGTPHELEKLQRSELVPLELHLLGRSTPRLDPQTLSRLVLTRLVRKGRHHA
jgi:hypothetical protein